MSSFLIPGRRRPLPLRLFDIEWHLHRRNPRRLENSIDLL